MINYLLGILIACGVAAAGIRIYKNHRNGGAVPAAQAVAVAANAMIHITKVEENKQEYLPLLLLADPDENMIKHYLEQGELFVMTEQERPVCVAVVTGCGEEPEACELKNLAVLPEYQRKGNGTSMMRYLFYRFGLLYRKMYVGTSEAGVSFYEKLGFIYSHRIEGFFTENYPEPVLENGVPCVDMLYLKKELKEPAGCGCGCGHCTE